MKNLFLSVSTLIFTVLACKKNDTTKADSIYQSGNPDTSISNISQDSIRGQDSINTKTHIGGRKTSNNNTGNGSGNINAAVSDSAHPKR